MGFFGCHPGRKDEATKASSLLHHMHVILMCERGLEVSLGRHEFSWLGLAEPSYREGAQSSAEPCPV